MSEAFWIGIDKGFRWSMPIAFVLMVILYYSHPYERCERKYDNPTDIMECVWILEND
jgi:hypothetical protein